MGKQARRKAQAATQGETILEFFLGMQYLKGDGVPQDKVQAVRLFRQAADQGLADAQCRLGFCYDTGEGVLQDKAQAARLYRQRLTRA
jgi:TPR repeat protein